MGFEGKIEVTSKEWEEITKKNRKLEKFIKRFLKNERIEELIFLDALGIDYEERESNYGNTYWW